MWNNQADRMSKLLQYCQYLSDLDNYFDGPIKLFLDLYLANILNISAKIVLFV